MPKIIALSGKKQSGKDTCYNFLKSLYPDEIQQFYFAQALKKVCVEILGCPVNAVYGIDEEKNTVVEHLLWENFPVPTPREGPMTVREVMQYWGTEIFRKQYPNVWADTCIRAIKNSGIPIAVITDCRFPNEVKATQQAGGVVIRLTRTVFPNDKHISETALDDYGRFDAVLDNANLSINETNNRLYNLLEYWGYMS